MNQLLTKSIEQMVEGIVHQKKLDSVLHRAVAGMMAMPRTGMPGTRPIVGATGDLYTRINSTQGIWDSG